MSQAKNLASVPHRVSADTRSQNFGHEGAVVWLTGLSASGKSTLAMGLEEKMLALGYACYALDGDNIRNGLNANLGFSPVDRAENIRRVGEVAALFADAGLICITALISPYQHDRLLARRASSRVRFHEVYVSADLSTCEARDPKGLYRKARAGELCDFTGIDAPYEVPSSPDLIIDTRYNSPAQSLDHLLSYLLKQHPIR